MLKSITKGREFFNELVKISKSDVTSKWKTKFIPHKKVFCGEGFYPLVTACFTASISAWPAGAAGV